MVNKFQRYPGSNLGYSATLSVRTHINQLSSA